MKNIDRLETEIRDYVNNLNLYECYESNPDKWHVLCISMDTLGDTCLALSDFEAEGFGDSWGEQYLRLYGFFQAVFLQQDAIKYLYESLVQPFSKLELSLEDWQDLRELRNLTVGHPIEMKRRESIKRCSITRVSISSRGFTIRVDNPTENKSEFEEIDLQELYSGYKEEAIVILTEVLHKLDRWEDSG